MGGSNIGACASENIVALCDVDHVYAAGVLQSVEKEAAALLGAQLVGATVEWLESESPYRTVAHLLLPRQEIELLRQQDAYQNLSFSVWHALAAHRPLGGINRVRRWAYALSTAWRRQQTGAKAAEPPSTGAIS